MCNNNLSVANGNLITYDSFNISKEVIDLLWIADGSFQNYSGNKFMPSIINLTEPSLISLQMPIAKPDDINFVRKLDYYPSYASMEPEQRYIYLHWLQNPY